MGILEELWNGNIYPSEQYVRNDDEYFGAMRKAAEETKQRLSNLHYNVP